MPFLAANRPLRWQAKLNDFHFDPSALTSCRAPFARSRSRHDQHPERFSPRAVLIAYLALVVRALATLPHEADRHDPAHDLLAEMMERCDADELEDLARMLEASGH